MSQIGYAVAVTFLRKATQTRSRRTFLWCRVNEKHGIVGSVSADILQVELVQLFRRYVLCCQYLQLLFSWISMAASFDRHTPPLAACMPL